MDLNMGPQHPSTHGVLRLKLHLNGEVVERCEPVLGYLHRAKEKIAEKGQWIKFMPITDRMDYIAGIYNNWGYARAMEELHEIEVPERAEYLRVVSGELQRLASHYLFLGTFGLDLGMITPFFYSFGDREKVLGLIEELTGARLTITYFRFGGVKWDAPEGWFDRVESTVDELEAHHKEMWDLLVENDILNMRLRGVGVMTEEEAVSLGCTGPVLRATGKEYDIRKDDPYGVYPRMRFDVPTETTGDCYGRFMVRIREMKESFKIIRQALREMPDGPIIAKGFDGSKIIRTKPPNKESYGRVETPKGELGFWLVSDNSMKPYRVKARGHSFSNLHCLPLLVEGSTIADTVVSLASLDIVLGDIDR
ncbi:MAG: NADH-quinone oxidoreductase subunit D [Euryarchaeota archaeon]|nr:NADH-quinone oxidoreductase subunit D [Euryarchaeota archaeon]